MRHGAEANGGRALRGGDEHPVGDPVAGNVGATADVVAMVELAAAVARIAQLCARLQRLDVRGRPRPVARGAVGWGASRPRAAGTSGPCRRSPLKSSQPLEGSRNPARLRSPKGPPPSAAAASPKGATTPPGAAMRGAAIARLGAAAGRAPPERIFCDLSIPLGAGADRLATRSISASRSSDGASSLMVSIEAATDCAGRGGGAGGTHRGRRSHGAHRLGHRGSERSVIAREEPVEAGGRRAVRRPLGRLGSAEVQRRQLGELRVEEQVRRGESQGRRRPILAALLGHPGLEGQGAALPAVRQAERVEGPPARPGTA